MNRLGVLMLVLPLVAGQAAVAGAGPGGLMRQQEELPAPTPLEDPYLPPAGDPDITEPEDGPGDEPSPLNPQGD